MRRMRKRVRCSARETENHSLTRPMPSPTSKSSNCRCLLDERVVLGVAAVPHHPFDARPVVPGPIEQHHLPHARQVDDVALEIPFAPLPLAGLLQRDHLRPPGIEVLEESLDRPPFAGGVPALEEDDNALTGVFDPVLQLEQLDLQEPFDDLVLRSRHALGVGIALAPGVDQSPVLPAQDRLVVVVGLVELELVQVLERSMSRSKMGA